MNNRIRRTITLRAHKNFGRSDVLLKTRGGIVSSRVLPPSWTALPKKELWEASPTPIPRYITTHCGAR